MLALAMPALAASVAPGRGPSSGPAAVIVKGLRAWPAPEQTRLVFEVSGPLRYAVFPLTDPDRMVIDLENARATHSLHTRFETDTQVRRLRSARRGGTDLRVVLDLKRPVTARSFLLKPNSHYGHRLVVDLEPVASRAAAAAGSRGRASRAAPPVAARGPPRLIRIAIDPGHGGEDPGALGPNGVREKDVTLRIARRLKTAVDRLRGFEAFLTRNGDYYVRLRSRMERARRSRADLFVSVHADAFRDRRVRGSSVYVLSGNGASSEAAKWLADQENASDLVGGVSLDDKDEVLASVLLDLSQAATLSASGAAAHTILMELNSLGKLHKRAVQRAGFVVLKSPDIPSVLIETGFITNPSEARRLKHSRYQRRLAAAVADGIRRYFERNPPDGTLLAARRHVILPGETLSHI